MNADITQTVAAVITTIAPFTPFLIEVSKAGAKKLAETIAAIGGETAWKKAQDVWAKIRAHFSNDSEVTSAVTLVAAKPDDESRQTMLAEVLGARLKEDPAIAQELFDLLGGQESIQMILIDRSNWLKDVEVRMKGTGTQDVKIGKDNVLEQVKIVKE